MPPDVTGSGAFFPGDTGIGNTDDNEENASIDTGNVDDKKLGDVVVPMQYQICYRDHESNRQRKVR